MPDVDEKKVYEDSEILEKTGMVASNFRLFRKMLKRFGIIKNGQKLGDEFVEMLVTIKDEKENNGKTWEEAILDEIKAKYPDIKENSDENDNITKAIQATLDEIQSKYKEIDQLKSKMIDLVNSLK